MEQFPNLLNYYEELKCINAGLKAHINIANSNYNKFLKYVNYMEQKHLSNYVDILGVPECDEDCVTIIKNIASYLGTELSVIQAFRIPLKRENKSSKIVAEFTSFEEKQKFMELVKAKDLRAKQLNKNWINARIFVNESLTGHYGHLYYKVRMFANDNGFKFVWFHNCKFYLRKEHKSKYYIIQDESDLSKIA